MSGGRTSVPSGAAQGAELWLFTNAYPYGQGEPFLANELPTLVRRFGRVRIFPMFREEGVRALPPGAEVTDLFADPFAAASPSLMARHAGSVRRMVSSLARDIGGAALGRAWRGQLTSRMRQLVQRMHTMEQVLLPQYDPARVVLYAYWTHDWATQLALLKVRHPQLWFVTRAHGFDLYEHQHRTGVIPFRQLQLQGLERMCCVSQAGVDHMRTRHPQVVHKVTLARLGTLDHGFGRASTDGVVRVVSCGYVIPRKRVELLAEALLHVRTPVHWTHFGDGPGMAAVRAIVAKLPPHVQVDLRGATPNSGIMAWYAAQPVDVHVLTSRLEGGVAVVLQEAASFGIPLIATDSGGVRDIVNAHTGVLLPTESTPEMIAEALEAVPGGPLSDPAFRSGVRAFWQAHFQAEATYDRFCDELLALLAQHQPPSSTHR